MFVLIASLLSVTGATEVCGVIEMTENVLTLDSRIISPIDGDMELAVRQLALDETSVCIKTTTEGPIEVSNYAQIRLDI